MKITMEILEAYHKAKKEAGSRAALHRKTGVSLSALSYLEDGTMDEMYDDIWEKLEPFLIPYMPNYSPDDKEVHYREILEKYKNKDILEDSEYTLEFFKQEEIIPPQKYTIDYYGIKTFILFKILWHGNNRVFLGYCFGREEGVKGCDFWNIGTIVDRNRKELNKRQLWKDLKAGIRNSSVVFTQISENQSTFIINNQKDMESHFTLEKKKEEKIQVDKKFTKQCPKCRTNLAVDIKVCPQCNTNLEAKWYEIFIGCFGSLIILILIIWGFFSCFETRYDEMVNLSTSSEIQVKQIEKLKSTALIIAQNNLKEKQFGNSFEFTPKEKILCIGENKFIVPVNITTTGKRYAVKLEYLGKGNWSTLDIGEAEGVFSRYLKNNK